MQQQPAVPPCTAAHGCGLILALCVALLHAGARSAVGEALGATDLHSLVHLLSGPAANLAAAALQMPAGGIQQQGTTSSSDGSDGTPASVAQHANGSSSSSGGGSSSSTSWCLGACAGSSLTPKVSLAAERCLAESLTLRGALCRQAGEHTCCTAWAHHSQSTNTATTHHMCCC
jgi:hypothetical protein